MKKLVNACLNVLHPTLATLCLVIVHCTALLHPNSCTWTYLQSAAPRCVVSAYMLTKLLRIVPLIVRLAPSLMIQLLYAEQIARKGNLQTPYCICALLSAPTELWPTLLTSPVMQLVHHRCSLISSPCNVWNAVYLATTKSLPQRSATLHAHYNRVSMPTPCHANVLVSAHLATSLITIQVPVYRHV